MLFYILKKYLAFVNHLEDAGYPGKISKIPAGSV